MHETNSRHTTNLGIRKDVTVDGEVRQSIKQNACSPRPAAPPSLAFQP